LMKEKKVLVTHVGLPSILLLDNSRTEHIELFQPGSPVK
jgi:hypothetical protein